MFSKRSKNFPLKCKPFLPLKHETKPELSPKRIFYSLFIKACGFTCHKTKCGNIESVNCKGKPILNEKEKRGDDESIIIVTTNEIAQQAQQVELEMFKSNSYEIRTHSFREATFKIPTRCGNCDKMIVGIYKQMLECESNLKKFEFNLRKFEF